MLVNKVKYTNQSNDIYFEEDYLKLYELLGEGKVKSFNFKKGGYEANYQFLQNSVNELGYDLQSEYFDIQSVYGYSGIITNSYDHFFIEEFFKAFDEYCYLNHIIAEFVRFHPLLENHKFSQDHLFIIFDRETIALNLSQTYDNIWANDYSATNRNMIRKAQKLGYTYQVHTNPTLVEIDQFIAIYQHSMKLLEAEKYYYFNKDFIYNTFTRLKKYTLLLNILNKDGMILCSSIFFHYGDFFHYHLSGRAANADNSVNNFLLDAAIKIAQKEGAKIFHFGGGKTNTLDDGLLKFKSNFSKTRLPFYIGKKIYNQEIYYAIVQQWETKYPEKKENFKNHILKYRY